jgi:hypothetical protein
MDVEEVGGGRRDWMELAQDRHGSFQLWRKSLHPRWRVCGKNLNPLSMCVVSPDPWCTHRTSLVVKKIFSFPEAVNNSIKLGSLVFLLHIFVIMENIMKRIVCNANFVILSKQCRRTVCFCGHLQFQVPDYKELLANLCEACIARLPIYMFQLDDSLMALADSIQFRAVMIYTCSSDDCGCGKYCLLLSDVSFNYLHNYLLRGVESFLRS